MQHLIFERSGLAFPAGIGDDRCGVQKVKLEGMGREAFGCGVVH